MLRAKHAFLPGFVKEMPSNLRCYYELHNCKIKQKQELSPYRIATHLAITYQLNL